LSAVKNQGLDVLYVKMRYPKHKGMTEIKAYFNNEGRFICESALIKSQFPK
jgi:hypothetical protein